MNKEIERLNGEIARYNGKLNNPNFVSKAPENVVAEERRKLSVAEGMMEKLLKRKEQLG